MNSITNLTAQQLRRAANLKEKIAGLEQDLAKLLGSEAAPAAGAAPRKWKMSAAGRAKIAAAARARWARVKGDAGAAPKAARAKRRAMSPAAKAKISAKLKAAWAKRKAAAK